MKLSPNLIAMPTMLRRLLIALAGCLLAGLTSSAASANQDLTLRQLENKFVELNKLCRPASVGIISEGEGDGSGVIVSPDGIVLTAAHVMKRRGKELQLYLHDGRLVDAVSISCNTQADTAICRITTPAPEGGWPYRPLRRGASLAPKDWCFIISHGGSIQKDRPAPLKIGRLLKSEQDINRKLLTTDCTAIHGDSGGPLFDLDGNVAGILTSMVTSDIHHNNHIAIETLIDQWGAWIDNFEKLPTHDELAHYLKVSQLAKGRTGQIPAKQISSVRNAIKKSYPDFSPTALRALSDVASFDGKKVTLVPDLRTFAILKAEQIDPAAFDLSLASNADDIELNRILSWIERRFGKLPQQALDLVLPKIRKDEFFKLSLDLTESDHTELRGVGVDLQQREIDQTLRFQYAHLGKEGKSILRGALKFGASGPTMQLAPEDRFKLSQMGIYRPKQKLPIAAENKGKSGSELAPQLGDSAPDVQAKMPKLPPVLGLEQSGKQVAFATAISPRLALSKLSALKHHKALMLRSGNDLIAASVIGVDKSSDLVLLEVEADLHPITWASQPKNDVGRLVIAPTLAGSRLGAQSVTPRAVPERPTALKELASGNPVNQHSQLLSSLSSELSARRTKLPECIFHDTLIYTNECGGPLCNLDGKVIGINIAHFSRTTNYALTKSSVDSALARLRQSPPAPSLLTRPKEQVHVFFWMGGSNMIGAAPADADDLEVVEDAYLLYNTSTIGWQPFTAAVVERRSGAKFSPAAAFVENYQKANPGVTVCLVPIVAKSSPLNSYLKGGRKFEQFHEAFHFLKDEATVKGAIWQGGEISARKEKESLEFGAALITLIEQIRSETKTPKLPFVIAGPGPWFHTTLNEQRSKNLNHITTSLEMVAKDLDCIELISTVGLTAIKPTYQVNFDKESAMRFGQRIAEAFNQQP